MNNENSAHSFTEGSDSGTLKFSKPTPNFPKGGEEIKDGEFVSSVKEETKHTPLLTVDSINTQLIEMWDAISTLDGEDKVFAEKQANEVTERLWKQYHEQEEARNIAPQLLKENQELKALLEIAHQYVTVFLIRGEDPLAGEQIKDHSYKILKALGRSI